MQVTIFLRQVMMRYMKHIVVKSIIGEILISMML